MEIIQYEGTDFVIDVPVLIKIWIRPDCQKKQFDVIKKAKPSILFIQSDGGRNENENKIIKENRSLIENGIDWKCKVYKIYEENNLGLYTMGLKVEKIIWNHVDRCILTEDDQLPSVSFFRFCAELLEKYKDDERIECICGMNHLGTYNKTNSDYFFSRQGSIWGVATWKRVTKNWGNYEYGKDKYTMDLLKKRTKYDRAIWKRLKAYSKHKLYEGHPAGAEFWIEFDVYAKNRLQIIPKYNLISNIGATEKAAHSGPLNIMPKKLRQVFNKKVFELDYPISHPEYVIPDIDYEIQRNRIMGYNTPIISFFRRFEYYGLLLKNEGVRQFFRRIKRKVFNENRVEK